MKNFLKGKWALLCLLPLLLLLVAPSVQASTTWYIRQDGGTNTQCTGKTNAAYTGGTSVQWLGGFAYTVGATIVDSNNHLQRVTTAGTSANHYQPTWNTSGGTVTDNTVVWTDQGIMPANQACAYNHPFQMLNYSGAWVAFVGGDTIQFADPTSVAHTYYMGEYNNAVGQDWSNPVGGICPQANAQGSSCELPAPPSGTSGAHTKILGQNAGGSCNDTAHSHLVNPTVLSGISNVFTVLDLRATNYVDVACIEITQPDNCTNSGAGDPGNCAANQNFVHYGGIMFNYGQNLQGPANLNLTDVAVVGTAGNGILGSKLNVNSSDTVTFQDVYIIGNGGAGWNADGGNCETYCETLGTVNIHNSIFDWNGCQAVVPYDMTKPDTQNAFNYCYDQNTGGYGDGFVVIAAGNMTLNVDHTFFRWNTQDGFDALHLNDDVTTSPAININTSWSEGNEGATFKIGAGTTSTAINNVSIGNCRVLTFPTLFPLNPTGWSTYVSDVCRAAGDQWSLAMKNGAQVILENNTSIGYGTTMYNVGCAALAPNCTDTYGATLVFRNNISYGIADPGNANRLASGFYFGDGDPFANAGSAIDHNDWYNMDDGCPTATAVPYETVYSCNNPGFTNANVNAFNPVLTSGAAVIGAGVAISGLTTDYSGYTRPNPPAQGALEYQAGAVTLTNITVTPSSGATTVGSSVTFTAACTYSNASTTPCSGTWTDTAAHSSVNSVSGVVTGVSVGSDTITYTISTVTGTATVTVSAGFNRFQGAHILGKIN